VAKIEMIFFYSSGGQELDCTRRVVGDGNADLMLQFQLKTLETERQWDEALSEDETDAVRSS
jgi:hypothetical protein